MSANVGSFDVSGMIQKLQQVGADWEEGVDRGLWKAAEYLRGKSQQQVPHDTGDLESTADVSQDKENHVVAVSYNTPYAVEQHENMNYAHTNGRKAKYLEDPMNDPGNRARMRDLIAKEVQL